MQKLQENPTSKIRTVMLIDDDETTNFINKITITKALKPDEILVANDGLAAIKMLKECCRKRAATGTECLSELILLDINMPVMDGFTFLEVYNGLEELKDQNIIVAVLTTSLNYRDIERAKNAGITDFLNKPLIRTDLLALANKLCVDQ